MYQANITYGGHITEPVLPADTLTAILQQLNDGAALRRVHYRAEIATTHTDGGISGKVFKGDFVTWRNAGRFLIEYDAEIRVFPHTTEPLRDRAYVAACQAAIARGK